MSPESTLLGLPVNNPSNIPVRNGDGAIGGQVQLYALIKRRSEYHHQHNGKTPFAVEFTDSGFSPHIVLGNDNRYRIADLRFYVKLGERFVALS
jgi:hypothetical protein